MQSYAIINTIILKEINRVNHQIFEIFFSGMFFDIAIHPTKNLVSLTKKFF